MQGLCTWLSDRHHAWRDTVKGISTDGFTGLKTATTEELADSIPVLGPFHVTHLVDEALDQC